MAVRTGIEIVGRAVGLGVLGTLAKSAKVARSAVLALGSAARSGLSGAAELNGKLEIAKKILGGLAAAYRATAGAALELRAANDPARKEIEALSQSTRDVSVAIGDALLPGVAALATSLQPLVRATADWLERNRDLLATDLAGWMERAARTGAQLLGVAIVGVAKAFFGVQMVVDVVRVAVNEAFGAIASGSAVALRAAADIAESLGRDGIAAGMRETADAADGLGREFTASSAVASASLMETTRELAAVEAVVEAAGRAVDQALAGTGARAAQSLTREVRYAAKETDALAAAAEKARSALVLASVKSQIGEAARDVYKHTGALTEQQYRYGIATAKAAETEQARVDGMRALRAEYGSAADAAVASTGSIAAASEALAQRKSDFGAYAEAAEAMAATVAGGLADTVVAIASGTMDAGKALGKFVGDTIKNLGTLLVQLGTAALLANALSVIPIFAGLVGPPGVGVGVAAAAIAGGAALVAVGSAIGMADGGMVRAPGVNGTDSVFAQLAPGELVVPYPEVQRNVREGRAPGDSGAPRGASGINVHVTQQSLVPANDAQWRRTVERTVIPLVQEALRTGRLRLA